MVKLAVITHTSGRKHNPPWFHLAMDSIQKNLPMGAEHKIIPCQSHAELAEFRWASIGLADYICFVDDDDMVLNDSLRRCLEALEANPTVGVVFTNERYIDGEGLEIQSPHAKDRVVNYEQIMHSAQVIHHLVMIRTKCVDLRSKLLSERLGIGGEWMLKGATALKSGAIHLPIEGYAWRQHTAQHSKDEVWRQNYSDQMHLLTVYLASQNQWSGAIPQFG